MQYRFIYPLFEDSEIEEASEYIVDRILNGDGNNQIKIMRENDDGETEMMKISEAPNYIAEGLVGHLVKNTYGINAPLMANYFKTEDVYLNSFVPHILKYLDLRGFNAESVSVDTKSLTLRMISVESRKPGFQPISRWNPVQKWISMDYTDNRMINLMNPLNQCTNCGLVIKPKDQNKYIMVDTNFIMALERNGLKCNMDRDNTGVFRISINVLPQKSIQPILKLVKLIHKYF